MRTLVHRGIAVRSAARVAQRLGFWLAGLGAAATAAPAFAQTAGMMSFQAVLRDGVGDPVIGAVTLELQIVDAGNVVLDANGDGVVNAGDTFVVNTTAVDGVISVKYGPVAPAVFNGAARFLKATVTNPPLPALTPVEIVTPPAIAEQLNARGTGNAAVVTAANGHVGIGTTAPMERLHVVSDGLPTLTVETAADSVVGSSAGIQFVSKQREEWRLSADGGTNKFSIRSGLAPGTTRILIDGGTGNIGIGTTTPDQRLNIAGSLALDGTNNFLYTRPNPGSNVGATSLGFASAVGGVLTLSNNGANDIRAGRSSAGGALRFFVNNTADPLVNSNGIEALTLAADGKVGIGNGSPQSTLHVRTSGFPSGEVRISKNGGDQILRLGFEGGGANQNLVLDRSPGDSLILSSYFTAYALGGTAAKSLSFGTANRLNDVVLTSGGDVLIGQNGNVGIRTSTPAHTLSVNGTICGTTVGACSDARFKTNRATLADALALVQRLCPIRFDWRRDEFPGRNFDAKSQIGFIAQEVEQVIPEVVQQGSDGFYSVDYGRLTPLLTAAIQELHAKHNAEAGSLREANAGMKSEISNLRARLFEYESRDRTQSAAIDDLTRRLAQLEARVDATAMSGGPR